jgi:hypothetical protein
MDDSQPALIRHPDAAHCAHASLPSGRRPALLAMNDKMSGATLHPIVTRNVLAAKGEIVRRSGMSMLFPGKRSYSTS